ncbi:MAG: hypothetical protein ACRD9W_11960 [Terriglobia bacterium]
MKAVSIETIPWEIDHPTGSLAFKYLLSGDEASPDNFVLLLARQQKHFATERHRHNFDQFRFPISGDMNVGTGIRLPEGQLGYFTEGAPYGPQDDPLEPASRDERIHLTLQFGGATGYGYLGPKRLRAVRDELRKEGEFVDVHYRRHDGKMQGGLDAVWQRAFGSRLEYPRPRYPGPIIMDPRSFRWLADAGATEVECKHLGAFTERGVWAEILRLKPGAMLTPQRPDTRRLFFVLSGSGDIEGTQVSRHSAIQLDPGETGRIRAKETLELLLFGLPTISSAVAAAPSQAIKEPASDRFTENTKSTMGKAPGR